MRRGLITVIGLLLCLILCLPVAAATGISSMENHVTAAADGSCQVSMSVTIHLEQAVDKLYFPLPGDAIGVTLNGSRVSASKSNGVRNVNLTRLLKGMTGDFTFHIHYSLHDIINTTETGSLQMELPLLSGFQYPVEKLAFSVTLPGQTESLPAFVSGYHQARIEEHLTYTVNGNVLSGTSLQAMKDHETLTMTMPVTDEMFPQTLAQAQDYHVVNIAMAICAGLALLYWLIGMWNLPVLFPRQTPEPPHGYHAGCIGSIVAGQGVDLSMMILSWAQLGYVLIQVDRQHNVILHKRMDMGNERSLFERRCFGKLFGKRNIVDTSGARYAAFTNSVSQQYDGMQDLMHRRTATPKAFRFLASGIGLCGGAGIAVALTQGAALQIFLMILMGALGAVSGWIIQSAGAGILLSSKEKTTPGLILCGIWLIVSIFAGAIDIGLIMCFGLLVAGILLAWGGRRTPIGRQILSQVLGLRKYFRKADKKQLQRICENDPEYFFRLVPYAMALGADKAFAQRFDGMRLNGCPYLTTGMDGHMTALQWCSLIRRTVVRMDQRARQLPLERFIALIQSFTKYR